MEKEFELIAKTFQGLEEILARELTEIGANNIQIGRRVVSFTGTRETVYRANYALRTAIRILKPLKHFKASNADEVYDAVKNYDWGSMLDLKTTFAVDSVVYSENFRYSKFVAYKVKDAIVDYFREAYGQRPNISVTNPGIRFHIHVSDDDCTLSLDSSGESLHKRGYRVATVDAPMNEILAAAMVMLTGWQGECDFIDPMCGSGTIAIEACMLARNIAPGRFRKEYAFEKWPDFNADIFEAVKKEYEIERPFEHMIYAYDNDPKAVAATKANVEAAGMSKDFAIACSDFRSFTQPVEKAIMVTNPPYGVRISTANLLGLYRTIGERLKHQFVGNEAWIISNHEECFDSIGLKPSLKIPLFNGSLDCQLQKYQIFSGKLNEFRGSGNELKTEEELRAMSEKHRFKEKREFKKRVDEPIEEDYGDIPDYRVRKHREFEANEKRKERRAAFEANRAERGDGARSFRRDDRDRRGGYAGGRNDNRFGRNDSRNGRDGSRDGRKSEGRFSDSKRNFSRNDSRRDSYDRNRRRSSGGDFKGKRYDK